MCTYVVCASESLLDSIQKHIKILLVSFSAATAATNIKAGRRKICPKREFTIPFLSPALSYFANFIYMYLKSLSHLFSQTVVRWLNETPSSTAKKHRAATPKYSKNRKFYSRKVSHPQRIQCLWIIVRKLFWSQLLIYFSFDCAVDFVFPYFEFSSFVLCERMRRARVYAISTFDDLSYWEKEKK